MFKTTWLVAEWYSAEKNTKTPHQASVKLTVFVCFVASYICEVFLLKARGHYKVEWRRVYNYHSV